MASSVEEAELSVVRIDVKHRGGQRPLGTGFAISSTHVVTNFHVVADVLEHNSNERDPAEKKSILVVRSRVTGVPTEAKVVAKDQVIDLAVLELSSGGLRPLALHLPEPRQRQTLISIGFPGNLFDATGGTLVNSPVVSSGEVSQILRKEEGTPAEHAVILHSTPTAPGNSGGPMLDDCYRVIGITARGYPAERGGATLYYAIQVKAAHDLAVKAGIRPVVSDATCRAGATSTWQWVLAIVLSSSALLVALRRPRERIIRVVEQASRKVSDGVSSMVKNALGGNADGKALMVLSGFMPASGNPLRVPVTLPLASERVAGELSEFVIGRSAAVAHFTIDDASLSRRHVRIFVNDASQLLIEDLNSTAGSYLNGARLEPLTPTAIHAGDTLMIGNLSLTVLAGGRASRRTG